MKRPRVSQEIWWLIEEKYRGQLTPSAKKDMTRLQKGEHVDYVIGFVDFLGCSIDLSLRPFIPRPETEYWVEKAIEDVQKDPRKNIRCLDIFAGSGCIGIAVLKHVPDTKVDFAEKEKKFCKQITFNAKLNKIAKSQYRVIQSDVFSQVRENYDYIFANPPYIAELRRNKVQASVLKHEPKEALFAGKDGLDVIRPFLRQAKDFLAPEGIVYLEFDSFQKRLIEHYLKKLGYQSWKFFKDQYGKWRWVKIVYNKEYGSRQRTPARGARRSGRLKRSVGAIQP